MATLYDVCKKTGLSTATVSRVINDSSAVTEKTRKIVQDAIKELDYRPNQAARMLAGKKSDTIGVIFPEIDNGFYVQVLRGIDNAAREANLHLLTAFYHDKAGLKHTIQSLAARGRTDSIVMINNDLSDRQVKNIVNNAVPIVMIGHSAETSASFDVVGIDNTNGAAAAVTHLLEAGIEDILLLTGPADNFDSIQRLNGAKMAYEDAGKDFSKATVLESFFTYEGGIQHMTEYLDAGNPVPSAMFAFNDRMALGAIEALKAKGKSVPEDLIVVGFDDTEIALYAGLTSVHVPMQDIGYEAANLAIRRIGQDKFNPSTVTVTTSLTMRGSTGK
jgi:DNA-binding LacI/PurR family transcriptional regulator